MWLMDMDGKTMLDCTRLSIGMTRSSQSAPIEYIIIGDREGLPEGITVAVGTLDEMKRKLIKIAEYE